MAVDTQKRIMLTATVFLVASFFLQADCQATCGFPSSWQYTWWRYNDAATNAKVFRSYGMTFERNERQVGNNPVIQLNMYDCQEEEDVLPFMFYVRRLRTNINVEDCVKGYANRANLQAQLLVIQSISTGTTGYTAMTCATRNDFSSPVDVFVRHPFDFSAEPCPFPSGRYQVALNTVSATQTNCNGDRESYVNIRNGAMTFQTCLSGSSYQSPFKNTELQCVGVLAPSFVGSTADNGNVLILAHAAAGGLTNFYTARYRIASSGAIVMSLQGSTSGRLRPDPSKGFTSVGVVNSNFDYSYLMQPANCANTQCENGATCQDNPDGTIGFQCNCVLGYTGMYCETDINECPAGECSGNGVCTDLVNDYRCDCTDGYVGKDCETRDYCHNDPCGDNGQCSSLSTTYQCTCDEGYVGTNCETQQFCYNGPCQNGGICREESNGYSCSCQAGYVGTNCETFQHCYDSPCQFGSCSEGTNDFVCTCQPGYEGKRCDRELHCFNNPCKNGGVCSDDGQSYTCDCPDGFTDPECSTVVRCHNNLCLNGATCREEDSSYSCLCLDGYTGWNCGSELHCQNQPCKNGGVCIEEANTYSCDCPDGFTGYNCDTADLCSNLPCKNGGQCIELTNGIQCNCEQGYSGDRCEVSPGCTTSPCQNGGTCLNEVNGGYSCRCTSNYQGMNCQNPVPSGCENNLCQNNADCDASAGGYKCTCLDGYYGEFCQSDRCAPNPCENGGTCVRQGTSLYDEGYTCDCMEGYGGPTCSLVGGCTPDSCDHGQCGGDEDNCMCEDGWSGPRCDEENFDWTVLIVILVVLMVLVFVVLAILVCVCCVMRNKGNGAAESRPRPGPVTPAGPAIREVIIPPQSVQVIDVSKQQQKPPNTVATRAMFMSDNPQKVYNVNNPLDYTYTNMPSQPVYSQLPRPATQPPIRYIGALEPAGMQGNGAPQQQRARDIDASIYPDVDAGDYIKFGANALPGSKQGGN